MTTLKVWSFARSIAKDGYRLKTIEWQKSVFSNGDSQAYGLKTTAFKHIQRQSSKYQFQYNLKWCWTHTHTHTHTHMYESAPVDSWKTRKKDKTVFVPFRSICMRKTKLKKEMSAQYQLSPKKGGERKRKDRLTDEISEILVENSFKTVEIRRKWAREVDKTRWKKQSSVKQNKSDA